MPSTVEKLVAARTLVWDAKDTFAPGSPEAVKAYEAINAIEVILDNGGVHYPKRFDLLDGKGEPV